VIGASTAYHVTQRGVRDVVVVESIDDTEAQLTEWPFSARVRVVTQLMMGNYISSSGRSHRLVSHMRPPTR